MLICVCIAYAAGLTVFTELGSVFRGWIPVVGGVISFAIVFCLFYFPLGRPVADAIGERIAAALHRGRHIKSGSGIDEIPVAPKTPPCSICGAPKGPICPECSSKMNTPSTKKID